MTTEQILSALGELLSYYSIKALAAEHKLFYCNEGTEEYRRIKRLMEQYHHKKDVLEELLDRVTVV